MTEEKDLGVSADCTAKPTTHVAHAVMKANQLLGLIRRTFTNMDCDLMRRLYTSIVRPHLEYQILYGIQCDKNNLMLNSVKTKEIVFIDRRRRHQMQQLPPSTSVRKQMR